MSTICVIGMGYVGLTLSVTLADIGLKVVGIEINAKVADNLHRGVPHIHESRLGFLLKKHLGKNLEIYTNSKSQK